jgi:hypothetical protein
LVKVGLEYRLVEDQQGLEDLSLLVVASLSDFPNELGLLEGLLGLESLERQGWRELTSFVQSRVVSHCKVDVTHSNQFWVVLQSFLDELTGKRLVSKSGLDALEGLGMGRVVFVEDCRDRISGSMLWERISIYPDSLFFNAI